MGVLLGVGSLARSLVNAYQQSLNRLVIGAAPKALFARRAATL
jgi:hypothetical protein